MTNTTNSCGTNLKKGSKKAFVSSTIKESAFVKMENLKMKADHLDEYIAEHTTLVAELEWDHDEEISCQTFRKGLPPLSLKESSRWRACACLPHHVDKTNPKTPRQVGHAAKHWVTKEEKKNSGSKFLEMGPQRELSRKEKKNETLTPWMSISPRCTPTKRNNS